MALTKYNFYASYYKNKFTELISNPKLLMFYFDRFSKYQNLDHFDLLLVSYPKSGRTWLQNLLVEIGKSEFDIDKTLNTDTPISEALTVLGENNSSFPNILATHAKSSWEQIESLQDEEQISQIDFKEFKGNKIVYLHRDPRDVLVSQFYHIKLRNKVDKIDKEDLVSNKIIGIRKIVNFMNSWLDFTNEHSEHILRMSYENMKKDTLGSLEKLFSFIDVPVNTKTLQEAISKSELAKMQAKQASKTNKDPWTKAKNIENKNSFQSRKGKIGEHKDFFNTEQLSRINQIIDQHLDKSYGY